MKRFCFKIPRWARGTALATITLLPVGASFIIRGQSISQMPAFTPFETNFSLSDIEANFDPTMPASQTPPEDNVPPVPSQPGGTF